jgi:serine O-acetyltransferase
MPARSVIAVPSLHGDSAMSRFCGDAESMASPAGVTAIWDDFIMHCPERRNRSRLRQALVVLMYFVGSSGFHLCVLYRLGALCHRLRLSVLALTFEKLIYHLYHCIVPSSMQAGKGLWFPHPLSIVVADNVRLGDAVTLYQGVQLVNGGENTSAIRVGNGALIGADAMVLGHSVGALSIVGARAMVLADVPAGHVAIGHPARSAPLNEEGLADRRHVLTSRVVW